MRIVSITTAVIALLPLASIAAEVFDSPGPGYRQQAERLSSGKRSTDIRFNVVPPNFRREVELPKIGISFSKPIQLFDSPAAPKPVAPPTEQKNTERQ